MHEDLYHWPGRRAGGLERGYAALLRQAGPFALVARAENGYRVFTEEDFAWLDTIACLKGTGMELKDIRTFIRWCMQGDSTLQNRLDLILARKREVESQISQLRGYLNKLEQKIDHYRQALNASHPA